MRKAALAAHITASTGWIGADAAFLALSIKGLTSSDAEVVRASYLAMGTIAWSVIVPLSFASLLTGLLQALGTKWGLFRHYWVLVKFMIAVVAIVVLMIHTRPVDFVAHSAAIHTLSPDDLRSSRLQLVVAAGAGLLVLLVALTLGVFKPRGMTPYGWRKQQQMKSE